MTATPEDTLKLATDMFGEGSLTVFAELTDLYMTLLPDQQKVMERFFDMLSTGLKVTFEGVGKEAEANIEKAIEFGIEEGKKLASPYRAKFEAGIATYLCSQLTLRGVSQAQLKDILNAAYDHATQYAESEGEQT